MSAFVLFYLWIIAPIAFLIGMLYIFITGKNKKRRPGEKNYDQRRALKGI